LDFAPFIGKTTTNVEITNGVVEITIPETVDGAIRGDIENSATKMAQSVLGNLPAQFDYGKLLLFLNRCGFASFTILWR
jgi:hypothetical protein